MEIKVMLVGVGAMGAAVGRRLVEQGCEVITPLANRSEQSQLRAAAAGLIPASDAQATEVDVILSIIPPGEAVATAQRFAPIIQLTDKKPIYVDCNAVSPQTSAKIADVIEATGASFVDAGIVGGPPRDGYDGPTFYVSGPNADKVAHLSQQGLNIQILDGPNGNASALKLSYAGITKGMQALASVMLLASVRAGTSDALHAELCKSQPQLFSMFERQLPGMYSKAYRWVAEMEEIAEFVDEDPAAKLIFEGATQLYERIAADFDADKSEIQALDAFFGRG